MPQYSSADILIMAANDMSNTLKQPHHEVPFAHFMDNTITSLAQLAEIFKNKFKNRNHQNSLIRPSRPQKTGDLPF
jgi:hypothetical protein